MTWELKNDRPIYLQLMEQLKLRIISGAYLPGSKLPAVRELAAEASVNPNTMQKALSELERDGLLYANRTSGRFITEDISMIEALKFDLAQEQLTLFLEQMEKLGFTKEEIREFLLKHLEN
ncbi:GntR family transcriptional regulator [Acetivibrio ethanolgignens]|uniref:GntR family transcriptional regulator n=1 Tax=Acetivibrio ethanolgignens TaxID=290052 RepID=A0A0V8QBB7_9FIRM|nr:GntR family transcriptional regulator [Acetivibrio ethanolgignens]KSV57796.1 GntR family transcriptional regulator [Acetivibrio ethanolgignens]